jgi:uncharacterized delta-60 repeat protein
VLDLSGTTDEVHAMALQSDGYVVLAGSSFNATPDSDFALVRFAVNGTLDPSFGSGGIVVTDSSDESITAITLGAGGTIIAAGSEALSGGVLVVYNSSGVPLTGFVATGTDGASAVDTDSAGNILVSGPVGTDFGLSRFSPSGSIDTSFGSGGTVITSMGAIAAPTAVAVQSDDKVVVFGYRQQRRRLRRRPLRPDHCRRAAGRKRGLGSVHQ